MSENKYRAAADSDVSPRRLVATRKTTVRGYKVTVNWWSTSPADEQARRVAIARIIADHVQQMTMTCRVKDCGLDRHEAVSQGPSETDSPKR